MIISCCADVFMNDECTKGRDKRDDNHSKGVHSALRVLVTPAPCFVLTRSDQIGRLLRPNRAFAVGELSGGTISANSQGAVLAVPAIRASIGVDPGEYQQPACNSQGSKVGGRVVKCLFL